MEEVKEEMKKVILQMKATRAVSKEQMKNAGKEAGQDEETNID